MKTIFLSKITGVLIFTLLAAALFAQVKIGTNPGSINASAVLELEKSNQGLLITRVALTGATDNLTVPSPANSLLIYNTATAGSGGNAVQPGFYYWDNFLGRWKGLLTTSGPAGDVWIDDQNNILSVNSANQALNGTNNVILGELAFEDLNEITNNYIAIGHEAGRQDQTDGDADVVAIGLQAAFGNSASNLNAIGWFAGYGNSGQYVNAFGREAARYNTGFEVNAFGPSAAAHNIGWVVSAMGVSAADSNSANDVNAFGYFAAKFNQGPRLNAFGTYSAVHNTGQDVNALGWNAAYNNHGLDGGGNHINALGNDAAANNSGGSVNALGQGAARNNEGSLVNALGGAAGENNDGWSVNAFGNQSGQFNTGAELNAMGAMSAQYNTTACVNAFGLEAARYNTGYGTNALGLRAAKFNNGDHAVAIGDNAMLGDTNVIEGGGNIGIGYHAAMNVGGGQRNVCLGFDTQIPNPSSDDQINIGNNIIRDAAGIIQLKDLIQLTPLSDPPAGPQEGMIYYDSDDHKLKAWDGTTWQHCW